MSEQRVWHVGDFVEIECHDGAIFTGVLQDIQPEYIQVNGYGFADGTVKDMRPVAGPHTFGTA